MSGKRGFIKSYFGRWRQDLQRAEGLLDTEYHREAILVLSCYIGALAALRFPRRTDRVAYARIVNRYSGLKKIFGKVDLLFFYQWPRSIYRANRRSKSPVVGPYSKIRNYSQLKRSVVSRWGDEDAVRSDPKRRYRTIKAIAKYAPASMTRIEVVETMKRFSLVEVLYRFVRCQAVHSNLFPLVQEFSCAGGVTRFEECHLITGKVIYDTASNIVGNLESHCLAQEKWPWEFSGR